MLFGCLLALLGWIGLNSSGAILFAGVPSSRPVLIALNTLVYLYMMGLAQQGDHLLLHFNHRMTMVPADVLGFHVAHSLQPVWLTIFTSMFLHANFLHLAGNMLFLWIFGNNVEDIMGMMRYLLFYLLCGVIAAATHIAMNPHSTNPVLGASGAISGVLGAYLVRFPRAQVDTCIFIFFYFTVVRLPAIVVLGLWFLMQLLMGATSLLGKPDQSDVAIWAHIGGFIAGMILVNLFAFPARERYNR